MITSPARSRVRSRRRDTASPGAPRRGMSLVEVMVAMMILVGVLFALGGFTAKFAQASGQAQLSITANELAARRLDAVRTQPTYASIDLLAGTVSTPMDFSWYKVSTSVKRIGGAATDSVDYKLVTVNVTHPSLRKSVSKTTAMAAY